MLAAVFWGTLRRASATNPCRDRQGAVGYPRRLLTRAAQLTRGTLARTAWTRAATVRERSPVHAARSRARHGSVATQWMLRTNGC